MTRSHQRRLHGFSLIEVILILVIVAILAVGGMVAFYDMQTRAEANREATIISAVQGGIDMHHAQSIIP